MASDGVDPTHASGSSEPESGAQSPAASRERSLREFDYFASVPKAKAEKSDAAARLLQNQEDRRREELRRFKRRIVQAVLALAAVVAWGSLLWGYRDWTVYALRSARSPLKLGPVTTLHPSMIPHNSFVAIEGITGHRGVSQKSTLGLTTDRREWWFVELMGAQGVFIQVPDDPKRYGAFTEVKVQGRAVDPAREACCDAVFAVYSQEFRPLDTTSLRVIQVDARPGERRLPYLFALFIWFLLTTSFLFMLLKLYRAHRQLAGPRT